MATIEYDTSKLRPFTVDAARDQQLCTSQTIDPSYDWAVLRSGSVVVEWPPRGDVVVYSVDDCDFLRIEPMFWVQTSANDTIKSPVYFGDSVYRMSDAGEIEEHAVCAFMNGQVYTQRIDGSTDRALISELLYDRPIATYVGWVNVYGYGSCDGPYETQQAADQSATTHIPSNGKATPDRIACVRVEWKESRCI